MPMRLILLLSLALLSAEARSQSPEPFVARSGLDLASVVPTCADSVALPRPSGPYGVGAATYHWADEERPEELSADPDDVRQLIATVFYPATVADGRRPRPYVPELDAMRAALHARRLDGPRQLAAYAPSFACVATASFAGAELDVREAPYPVVLLSPGGNVSRHWHTALAQELTSHGYVVSVLSHPYSGMDVFPAGGLLTSSAYWDESDGRVNAELTDRLTADVRFALDRLVALNEADPGGRLAGRLDANRIAVVGHSRGGRAVRRGCALDVRFRACVVYDNLGAERERRVGLRQPQMVMRPPWPDVRTRDLQRYLALNERGAYDVVVEGMGHFSFSDLPLVVPEHFPSEIDPLRAHRLVSAYTRAFLDKHLRGRPAPRLEEGSEQPDGVRVHFLGAGR